MKVGRPEMVLGYNFFQKFKIFKKKNSKMSIFKISIFKINNRISAAAHINRNSAAAHIFQKFQKNFFQKFQIFFFKNFNFFPKILNNVISSSVAVSGCSVDKTVYWLPCKVYLFTLGQLWIFGGLVTALIGQMFLFCPRRFAPRAKKKHLPSSSSSSAPKNL